MISQKYLTFWYFHIYSKVRNNAGEKGGMMLNSANFLEVDQPDRRLLVLGVCPELSGVEEKCIRKILEQMGLKVEFGGPQQFHVEYMDIRTIRSAAHGWKIIEAVKSALKKASKLPNDPDADRKRWPTVSDEKFLIFTVAHKIAELLFSFTYTEPLGQVYGKRFAVRTYGLGGMSLCNFNNYQTTGGLFLELDGIDISIWTPWGNWELFSSDDKSFWRSTVTEKLSKRIKMKPRSDGKALAVLAFDDEKLPKPKLRDPFDRMDENQAWREWEVMRKRYENEKKAK